MSDSPLCRHYCEGMSSDRKGYLFLKGSAKPIQIHCRLYLVLDPFTQSVIIQGVELVVGLLIGYGVARALKGLLLVLVGLNHPAALYRGF